MPTPIIMIVGLVVLLVLASCGQAPPASSVPSEPSVSSSAASPPAPRPVPTPRAPAPTTEQLPPYGARSEFRTDFSKASIDYREVLSGGPPKDGIPAIDNPQFVPVSAAQEWLRANEPVVRVQVGDDARAYPLQILTWHELVNDTVGGLPLVVSFCPLCNTAIIFERKVAGQLLDFGTTGRLRFSNLIMYDRQTETWWQQATGEAIAGELTGTRLRFYPGEIIAWADFQAAHPNGQVLSRDTGFNRSYGRNPYVGYDDINSSPFLYQGAPVADTLPPMARVLTVELGDELVAYPYRSLEAVRVINDTVHAVPLVVFWQAGTASALDAGTLAEGRDVGTGTAFERTVAGQVLTFTANADGRGFSDTETGSQWDHLGQAVAGQLQGTQLAPVVAVNHFWFSWAAFRPDTRVYQVVE